MKINEIRTGQIFAIEGSKLYPKLRLDVGYVDMRDEIVNRHESMIIPLEVQVMTNSEVKREFKKYGMSTKDWKDLRKKLLEKYNRAEERGR